MRNYAKEMRAYCIVIFLGIFAAVFYFLADFRYDPEYFVYIGAGLIVVISALAGGSMSGLIASIFAIFLYAATFFYTALRSGSYFDITYAQGIWMFSYLCAALVFGKIGDGVNFYMNLHRKYPQDLEDIVQEYMFRMLPQKKFVLAVNNEIIRSRRMQTNFVFAIISVQDITEILRLFGQKGIYKIIKKITLYLRAAIKECDRVSKLSNTTLEILFAEANKDEVKARLSLLSSQLENSYVNYKGTTIKFAIKLSIGVAAFPQDGDDVYKLRDAAQKSLVEINCLCK